MYVAGADIGKATRVKVLAAPARAMPFRVLCARTGISRKTGYKWCRQCGDGRGGEDGGSLAPPAHSPNQTPAALQAQAWRCARSIRRGEDGRSTTAWSTRGWPPCRRRARSPTCWPARAGGPGRRPQAVATLRHAAPDIWQLDSMGICLGTPRASIC